MSSSAGDGADGGVNFEDGSNLELGPVLSVLTDEQKNLLICQAIQKDPSLAELVLQKVAEPVSPDDAASRVEALDGAAAVQAVRSFLEIDGAELNALTMLVALTDAVRDALHELSQVEEGGHPNPNPEPEPAPESDLDPDPNPNPKSLTCINRFSSAPSGLRARSWRRWRRCRRRARSPPG